MDKPLISVITVTFNAAEDLLLTLNSVHAQTYTGYEIIVIDGGSSDHTSQVAKDNNFMVRFYSEPDGGIYDAMNKGVSRAQGKWLHFLNSGDIYASPEILQKIADIVTRHPELQVVYSDVIQEFMTGRRTMVLNHERHLINHQALIYQKSIHETAGKYLTITGFHLADYLFFYNFYSLNCKFHKLDSPICISDPYGVSRSRRNYKSRLLLEVVFLDKNLLIAYCKICIHAFLYCFRRKR